jgi:hypothetical protein
MRVVNCTIDEVRVAELSFDGSVLRAKVLLLVAGSIVGGYDTIVMGDSTVVKHLDRLLEAVEKNVSSSLGEAVGEDTELEAAAAVEPLFRL